MGDFRRVAGPSEPARSRAQRGISRDGLRYALLHRWGPIWAGVPHGRALASTAAPRGESDFGGLGRSTQASSVGSSWGAWTSHESCRLCLKGECLERRWRTGELRRVADFDRNPFASIVGGDKRARTQQMLHSLSAFPVCDARSALCLGTYTVRVTPRRTASERGTQRAAKGYGMLQFESLSERVLRLPLLLQSSSRQGRRPTTRNKSQQSGAETHSALAQTTLEASIGPCAQWTGRWLLTNR